MQPTAVLNQNTLSMCQVRGERPEAFQLQITTWISSAVQKGDGTVNTTFRKK